MKYFKMKRKVVKVIVCLRNIKYTAMIGKL